MSTNVSMAANAIVFLVLLAIAAFCLYTSNQQGCALSLAAAALLGVLMLFHFWTSRQVRQQLTVTRVVETVKSNSPYSASCAICLNDFEDFDKLTQLPCMHAFHKECFDCWMAKSDSCPHCRAVFRTAQVIR